MTFAALPTIADTFSPSVASLSPQIERTRLVVAAIDTPLRPPIA
ncbi:MAG TPA: hypothetical protein VGO25_06305 [Rhodanobacteraceae bacterium]|nr:hypothetical protein [Rhodanobacteraceae bacterium]